MLIRPKGKKLLIKCSVEKIGNFDVSSKATAQEVGEIIDIGQDVVGFSKGDKIMFKAWGIDSIEYQNEKYNFIDFDSPLICAIIE